MRFENTPGYVASEPLKNSVNAAIALQRPLLIKGEPGTGKTMLAEQVAKSLGAPFFQWHIKSTTKAQQGLYEYDAVSRLRDSQLGAEGVHDISRYIIKGKLWEAFESESPAVVLIDEIDKADIEFPNDLLQELDNMRFDVYETKQSVSAKHRPIIIITSNNEKDLPAPFLRRCFFHFIEFPEQETLKKIVDVHFPDIEHRLANEAIELFSKLRSHEHLQKKPSTSELIDWLKLLMLDNVEPSTLNKIRRNDGLPPALGALFKDERDITFLQQIARRFN